MEIRKHVVSSAWASGCAVSKTYGRNYQRKMEITSGLGLIRSPEQSRCVLTILGSGTACLGARRLASCRENLACFLSPSGNYFPAAAYPLLPEDPAAAR